MVVAQVWALGQHGSVWWHGGTVMSSLGLVSSFMFSFVLLRLASFVFFFAFNRFVAFRSAWIYLLGLASGCEIVGGMPMSSIHQLGLASFRIAVS